MNEYICQKCGTPIKAEGRETETPRPEKMKLASLLSVIDADTTLFIIDYLGPHKYEAVFEGMARETLSNGILTGCGENIVLSVSPEINDTDPDDLTLPVLLVKISRGNADNNRKENVR